MIEEEDLKELIMYVTMKLKVQMLKNEDRKQINILTKLLILLEELDQL